MTSHTTSHIPLPHAYGSYDELLDSPEVDIYICTPTPTSSTGTLGQQTRHHEKPLALHLSEAQELFAWRLRPSSCHGGNETPLPGATQFIKVK